MILSITIYSLKGSFKKYIIKKNNTLVWPPQESDKQWCAISVERETRGEKTHQGCKKGSQFNCPCRHVSTTQDHPLFWSTLIYQRGQSIRSRRGVRTKRHQETDLPEKSSDSSFHSSPRLREKTPKTSSTSLQDCFLGG